VRWIRRGLLLAVFAAALVGGWRFAARNGAPVSVDLLVTTTGEAPMWLVLLVAFAAGAALVGAAALYRLAVLGLVARRYRKKLSGLEAEVHQLRNLPLAGDPGEATERGP